MATERKALQCQMEWVTYIEFRRRKLSDTRGNSKSQTRGSGVRKNKRVIGSHVRLIRHPVRRWQRTLPRDRVCLTRLQAMRGPLKTDRFLLDNRGPAWPGGKAVKPSASAHCVIVLCMSLCHCSFVCFFVFGFPQCGRHSVFTYLLRHVIQTHTSFRRTLFIVKRSFKPFVFGSCYLSCFEFCHNK